MNAIISTTYDDLYFYFLPLVTWSWNKIGVSVICFDTVGHSGKNGVDKMKLLSQTIIDNNLKIEVHGLSCPQDKAATYAQCSRLYAAALKSVSDDEVLITADIDMVVFGDHLKQKVADFDIFGFDLVPENQYPICYISATAKAWRSAMQINRRSYQECLDDLLGHIECQHFRGNYWGKDQEEAYNRISQVSNVYLHGRAKPGTQFSTRRVDRDNMFWEENLIPDLIDAHLWRPGYTEENFNKIMKLFQTMYPNDGFDWLVQYTEKYRQLL